MCGCVWIVCMHTSSERERERRGMGGSKYCKLLITVESDYMVYECSLTN